MSYGVCPYTAGFLCALQTVRMPRAFRPIAAQEWEAGEQRRRSTIGRRPIRGVLGPRHQSCRTVRTHMVNVELIGLIAARGGKQIETYPDWEDG